MSLSSPYPASAQRPTVLDSWSPAPVRVNAEQDQGGNSNNNSNSNNPTMLLNRCRELGQERHGDSSDRPSSALATAMPTVALSTESSDRHMGGNDACSTPGARGGPRLSVNKATGHISIATGSSSTKPVQTPAGAEAANSPSSRLLHASTSSEQFSPNVLPSPVTEQSDEVEESEELPLVFLGVVFGVVPAQWYSKSLAKWHSGVEALGGRFITPPTDSVPDLILFPLNDERSDLAAPVEAEVPEHWQCPIAVTSWITQCVMAGKLLELHNHDVPILGLDPLAVRLLERRKGRPTPSEQRPSVAENDNRLPSANWIQGISDQITRMGESIASQDAKVGAFVNGQDALHSQMNQMASAIASLTEHMHRSHQITAQRLDQLSGLLHNARRKSRTRDHQGYSSGIYNAVTDEARRGFSHPHNKYISMPPGIVGPEHGQPSRPSSSSAMRPNFVSSPNNVRPGASTSYPRPAPLPSPPDHDHVMGLPETYVTQHQPPTSRPPARAYDSGGNDSRRRDEAGSPGAGAGAGAGSEHDGVSSATSPTDYFIAPAAPTLPLSTTAQTAAVVLRDIPGASTAAQLGPLTAISPSELQALLRSVFSESSKKDNELFRRKAQSIYIEHLGTRSPRRVSITHVSEAQAVFPRRYHYDKIIFVSTVPGEDALAILFDMKENEVVIYDTVDRYRNNLFTFGKEKTLAEKFGLKDAAWYVVELVAETEKEDAFPLVCLATKIFASRDRKSFRDLFPPHVVVAKKNIKNPIPPRRQAKANYYWRLVRPRVISHLVKELSAVLLTRYRHEDTPWISVPKCSEWVEGLTRFEDSDEGKELLDNRSKGESSESSRPASSAKNERGRSAVSSEKGSPAQQKRSTEKTEQAVAQIDEPGESEHLQEPSAEVAPSGLDKRLEADSSPSTEQRDLSAVEAETEKHQFKRPFEGEPPSDPSLKKQKTSDPSQIGVDEQVEQ